VHNVKRLRVAVLRLQSDDDLDSIRSSSAASLCLVFI